MSMFVLNAAAAPVVIADDVFVDQFRTTQFGIHNYQNGTYCLIIKNENGNIWYRRKILKTQVEAREAVSACKADCEERAKTKRFYIRTDVVNKLNGKSYKLWDTEQREDKKLGY